MAPRLEEDLGTVVHDLRNPLTAMRLQMDRLERGAFRSDLDRAAAIQVVQRNLRRMDALTADLLDLVHLEEDRLDLRAAESDLVSLVKCVIEDFGAVAERQGVRVQVVAPEALRLQLDPERVARVLGNLLVNALKFARGGHVRVTVAGLGEDALVGVEDDGVGFDAAEAPLLFHRFARLPSAEAPGTGLGLYICKSIVERHGGRIWASSPGRGYGASFTFTLPRRAAIGSPSGVERSASDAAAGPGA